MSNPTAKTRYALKIFPAGRNDRVAEILDQEGNILRLIHCPHELGNSLEEQLDARIRNDWETMDASAFADKYRINGD